MGAKMTPLAQVKAEHGDKAKLVDKVLGVIDLGEGGKDEAKTRLAGVSNKKLLRLLSVGQTARRTSWPRPWPRPPARPRTATT